MPGLLDVGLSLKSRRPIWAGGLVSATHWRAYITDTPHGSFAGIREMQIRTVAGVSQPATGGTVLFSSQLDATYSAAKAFDGSTAGAYWLSASGQSEPSWIGYAYASAITPVELYICAPNPDANTAPREFRVEYSLNSGGLWTTLYTAPTQSAWGGSEERTFTIQ